MTPNQALTICLAAMLSLAGLAHAQTRQIAEEAPVGVRFAGEELRIDEIGLVLDLPEGIRAERVDDPAIVARLNPEHSRFLVNIKTPRLRGGGATPEHFIDQIVDDLRRAHGVVRSKRDRQGRLVEELVETRVTVEERVRNLRVGERTASRVYLRAPHPTADRPILMGYSVVQATPARFVVFELISTEHAEGESRAVYETLVASARYEDSIEAMAERGRLIQRGREAFTMLPDSAYRRVIEINRDRWERLYEPARSGSDRDARELGYRRIRASVGPRGAIDPTKSPDRYTEVEQEEGYLVRMNIRLLQPDSGNLIVDTEAVFWLAKDFGEEAWSIRMANRRRGELAGTYTELGLREGRRMQIIIEGMGETSRSIHPLIRGEGYISQVQTWLLPQLLAEVGIESEYAFYAYRSADERIRLRRDTVEKPSDRQGVTRIITQLVETREDTQETLLDSEGRFMRTTLSDGRVWEDTTLDRLARLWRSKGLPMN